MNKKDILRYVAIGLLGALTALSTQINNNSKIEKEVEKRLAKKEEPVKTPLIFRVKNMDYSEKLIN